MHAAHYVRHRSKCKWHKLNWAEISRKMGRRVHRLSASTRLENSFLWEHYLWNKTVKRRWVHCERIRSSEDDLTCLNFVFSEQCLLEKAVVRDLSHLATNFLSIKIGSIDINDNISLCFFRQVSIEPLVTIQPISDDTKVQIVVMKYEWSLAGLFQTCALMNIGNRFAPLLDRHPHLGNPGSIAGVELNISRKLSNGLTSGYVERSHKYSYPDV